MNNKKPVVLSGTDDNGKNFELMVGGKDRPSRKNLVDYISKKGRMNLLRFYIESTTKNIPTLLVKCRKEAARKAVEVGCERFFSLSGDSSAPRRTQLDVRAYEHLTV